MAFSSKATLENWKGQEVKIKGKKVVNKSAFEIGLVVEGQAKLLCAVNYGYLAASITTQSDTKGTELENPSKYAKEVPPPDHQVSSFKKIDKPNSDNEVLVGSAVDYACIFGSNTLVRTKLGNKRISVIEPGDYVLTQTGEYHKVIRRIENKAIDMPNLVKVVAEYRSGIRHTLITTSEHKFLVYREGRNKWVKANELENTDKLFSMIKVAHNKLKNKFRKCEICERYFLINGNTDKRKFCSIECRNIYYKESNPNIGSTRSIETKKKMSILKKAYLKEHPEKHVNRLLAKKGFSTDIELKVERWLTRRGKRFYKQKRIGRVYVDFYLPYTYEIIECDGAYWHSNQVKDIKRDKYILDILPEVKITHLHFYDKRFSHIIDEHPFDTVTYQVCNPDPDSYVDLSVFEKKDIVSIKKFKYKKRNPHASLKGKVYDLEIDKVHSYYANGLLVSNSHVEFGTVRMNAQPFLRPSLDLAKGKAIAIITVNGKQEFKEYF